MTEARFQIVFADRWQPHRAIDQQTGRTALRPTLQSHLFLDVAAVHAMAKRVHQLGDPRVAEVLSLDLLWLSGPPEERPTGTLEEWATATVECIDVILRLRREGIAYAPYFSWAERRAGRLVPVIFAPSHGPGLHTNSFEGRDTSWMREVEQWLAQQLPKPGMFDFKLRKLRRRLNNQQGHETAVRALFVALKPFLTWTDAVEEVQRAAIESKRGPWQMDFDHGIELGEAEYAAVRDERRRWDAPPAGWALAAAYHHRGCVAWADGNREQAVRDVDRAIEVDPHPRYLTTRALWSEALDDGRAAELHAAAMKSVVQKDGESKRSGEPGVASRRQNNECRTALASAAFRHRQGDTAGAIADLRSVNERWFERWAVLGHPLGDRIQRFLALLTD